MTTTNRSEPRPEGGLDGVDLSAVIYLLLPVALFVMGWFRAWSAGVLLVLIIALIALIARQCRQDRELGRTGAALPWRWVVQALAVATIWSFFGGAGHWLHANHFDWKVRDAVLRDLTVLPWPVAYGEARGWDLMMRAPIAYFMPAAAVAKWTGLASADLLLYVWTVLGLALVIWLGLQSITEPGRRLLWLAILPLFSGMDLAGWILSRGQSLSAGLHLEWWAGLYQYSSNSTLLFWVPNHAVPGWLAAALLLKHWSDRRAMAWLFAALVAATPLWSPLVTISLAPFWLVWLAAQIRGGHVRALLADRSLWLGVACATVVFWVSSAWVGQDTESLPLRSTIDAFAVDASLKHWLLFQVLEWGLLAWLAVHRARGALFWTTIGLLLLLPLASWGPNNDLAMRGSIIPLALLMYFAVDALWHAITQRDAPRIAAISIVLAIGAGTPVQEFIRSISQPHWAPDLARNLMEIPKVYPINYVARWQKTSGALTVMLQPPAAVNPSLVPPAIVKLTPAR